LKKKNKTVHVNSAIHPVNNAVNCNVHMNNIFIYTVHANCIVQYSAINMHSKHKATKCCFFFSASQTQKTCEVRSIHSKLCIFCYQTVADCILIKTQPQPRKQTNSLSPLLKPLFDHPIPPHMPSEDYSISSEPLFFI